MAEANGHGGRRKGAGRPRGSRNKATLAREAGLPDAVEAAREIAGEAFGVLAEAMADGKAPWAVRVKAAGIVLDRAYGRPPAPSPRFTVKTEAEREPEAGADPLAMLGRFGLGSP